MKTCRFAIILTVFVVTALNAFAQQERKERASDNSVPEEKGFKKHHLFTGGGVTASFYTGGTVLGLSPVLGYKFNDYVDGGVLLHYVYHGARDWREINDKFRRHVYGPGIFTRVYPVPFIFVQGQLEHNFIAENYTAKPGSAYYASGKFRANATSLLLGGGLSTGRLKGGTTFFYLSVLADVLKNRNSPYVDVDYYGTPNEKVRIVPVIRAGVNVGLFQGRYGVYD
ncbi:hypothetical protein PIECOFPK_01110 [Mycovorax composti]|jgi:hypothetical protein|uniref:Outer membrane protein beta-barrel domain-containing protein n=2 Tax=Chitinophagaceae TaxID=563835 RepID=A0ABZ2EIU0_9BACT